MAFLSDFREAQQSVVDIKFLKNVPEYATSKPYYISGNIPQDQEAFRTNLQYEDVTSLPILNLRGLEQNLSIEKHGFEIIKLHHDITGVDVTSQRDRYMAKMINIVEDRFSAILAICYDCRVSTIY